MSTNRGVYTEKEALASFRRLHGPVFLGILLCILLLGVVLCQTVKFFSSSQSTRNHSHHPYTQLFIGFLVGSQTLKTVLDVVTIYETLIIRAGRAQYERRVAVTVMIEVFFALVPIMSAELWLLLRVYNVSTHNKPVTFLGLLLILSSSAIYLVASIKRILHPLYSDNADLYSIWTPTFSFLLAGTDVYLSFAFIWFMLAAKKQAISPRLGQALKGLISVSIQACLPPALCSIALAIPTLATQNTGASIFFKLQLSALYCISVLYTLNSREEIVQTANEAASRPQNLTPSNLAACGPSNTTASAREVERGSVESSLDVGNGGKVDARLYNSWEK